MLIENNLIESKKVNINITIKSTHIKNCDIIIVLNVKISRIVVQTLIYVRKIILIFLYIEIILLIYFNNIVSNNRDFLFEFNNLNVLLYAYLININFKNIFVKNDNNKIVQILRNCRVKRMIELDFSNVFQIHVDENNNMIELAMRKLFFNYKIN